MGGKIVSRIVKILLYVVIFGVIAALIARIILSSYYPARVTEIVISDGMRADHAAGRPVTVRRQALRISYDRNKDARFFAAAQCYRPEGGELQITLRYSDTTLAYLAEDFGLADVPAPDPALFDFSLRDADGNRYPLAGCVTDDAFLYHYLRLSFEGVGFREETNGLWLCIYYAGDVDYEREPYAYIVVYEQALAPDDDVVTLTEEDFAR